MAHLQRINHCGRLVAVVLAGHAVIEDTLTDEDFRHVEAMCLYALELDGCGHSAEYSDAAADAFAREALAAS